MNAAQHAKRLLALCLLLLTGFTGAAYALIVSLDAYVEFPILDNFGVELADGMTVMIIGSSDPINDGMETYGPGGTNLIANSVLNDDIILGTVTISSNEAGFAGGFFTTVTYDSDDVSYVYIRFFDAPPNALTGMIYWGTSSVFQLGVTLGVSTVAFDAGTNLRTTNYNNFVIIPEPSTANLFVMVAGMMCAMRLHMRNRMKKAQAHEEA